MEWEQHTSVTGTTLKTTPEIHNWHKPPHYISLSFIQQEQKGYR